MKFLNFLNPAHHVKKQICAAIEAELYKELSTRANTYYIAENVDGIATLTAADTLTRTAKSKTAIQTLINQHTDRSELDALRSFVDIDAILPTIGSKVAEALGTKQLIAVKGKKRAIFHIVEAGIIVKKDVKLIDLLEGNA